MSHKVPFARRLWPVAGLVLLLSADAAAQQSGCQNQECKFAVDCYQCQQLSGTGCRVDSCNSCTETNCVEGFSASTCTPADFAVVPTDGPRSTREGSYSQSGTSLNFLRQPADPAILVEATFGVEHLFQRGLLRNIGTKPIVAYRLGRVVLHRDMTSDVVVDEPVVLSNVLLSGQETVVPKQKASGSVLKGPNPPSRIVFFVAEVRFADGGDWRADLGRKAQEVVGKPNQPKAVKGLN